MIPILFGVTVITFLLFNVAAGNPAAMALGNHASAERIAQLERELGLDKPLIYQYFDFVKQVLTFDFGRSWSTKQTISSMILSGVGASLSLTVPSFFITLLITVSISLLLTQFRGSVIDKSVIVVCLAALSISSLVYILFFQYMFGYKVALFPINGWDPSWVGRWEYLTLPIIIFVVIQVGSNMLYYRTIFLDEIFQDYVRTAKAKGLSQKVILFKHVLRNAMVPIITLIVIQMPFLILGSLLLESFFGIPGVGGLVVRAINSSDFPVVKAMTVISSILYMIFQLLSDLLYAVVDPKIQLK
ncbi:MAG: ABC transporter permease [Bdellovibrionales bacterium]|nr:ABC transporter permease [Bdellovibrionales bacterium]